MSLTLDVLNAAVWQLKNPTGHVVATEDSCIKAWARIGGYKPTVENLLAYEQAGWSVSAALKAEPAADEFERGRQQGMKQERASWKLAMWSQEMAKSSRPEGEVVPLDEAEQILLGMSNPLARLP